MLSVSWMTLADMAYFDANDRLCVLGADTAATHARDVGVHNLTLVALLSEDDRGLPSASLRIAAPNGDRWTAEPGLDLGLECRGGCLIVRLDRVAFFEPGVYRVELTIEGAGPAAAELRIVERVERRGRLCLHGAR